APAGEVDSGLGFFETVRRVMTVPTIRKLLAAWAAIGVMVFPFSTYMFFFLDERWNVGPGGRAATFAGAWAVSLAALATFGRVGGIGGVALLGGLARRFGISGALLCLCGPMLVAAWIAYRAAPGASADLDRLIDEVVEREEIRIMQADGVHLPMLSCRHIDFSYGQLQVLFDVNFTVDD